MFRTKPVNKYAGSLSQMPYNHKVVAASFKLLQSVSLLIAYFFLP